VPLVDKFSNGPNVFPLSVLILITGVSLVALRSHHVTNTLSPDASICASCESALVELLRFILSQNVFPPSLDALNNTSSLTPVLFEGCVVHTTYSLSPELTIGVFLGKPFMYRFSYTFCIIFVIVDSKAIFATNVAATAATVTVRSRSVDSYLAGVEENMKNYKFLNLIRINLYSYIVATPIRLFVAEASLVPYKIR
jgi:hypothetical protein